ncbi:MAG: RNA polymerase sigma factor [Saprospiraceae bacterium]|nr:RNA polymerase sigma factor [Saprospiraceae bacterium]
MNGDDLNEEKIIAQIKSDSTSERDIAFESIFKNEAIRNRIRKAIMSNSGSVDDAENIFHESMLCLMQKTEDRELDIKKSVSSYLIGIAKNLWLNEIRKRKRRNVGSFNDITTEPSTDDDTQNSLEQNDYKQFLDEVVNQMSFKCRHLLVWYFDDYSAAENSPII